MFVAVSSFVISGFLPLNKSKVARLKGTVAAAGRRRLVGMSLGWLWLVCFGLVFGWFVLFLSVYFVVACGWFLSWGNTISPEALRGFNKSKRGYGTRQRLSRELAKHLRARTILGLGFKCQRKPGVKLVQL